MHPLQLQDQISHACWANTVPHIKLGGGQPFDIPCRLVHQLAMDVRAMCNVRLACYVQ